MAKDIKSYLVIGMGRFGKSVALTLMSLKQQVMCIDKHQEYINDIADEVTHALVADTSEERVLTQLGISNFDCVIVAIGDDLRASILTTVQCKEQGAKRIIAKAYDLLHAKLLLKTGADSAVLPERDSGKRLAHSLVYASVLEYIELSDEYSISEMHIPSGWGDRTLKDIDVRACYSVSIIAVKRDHKLHLTLDADFKLRSDDILVVLGANDDLQRVEML